MKPNFTEATKNEVAQMLRAGQRIQAIKYLGDTFNVSIDESKMLVETLEKEIAATSLRETDFANDSELNAQVDKMIRANQKLEAIKVVRQSKGFGLKEALEYVESRHKYVDPSYTPKPAQGCARITLKFVAFLFLAVAFFCFGIAAIDYLMQQEAIDNSIETTGTVVQLVETDDGTAPVIEYEWRGTSHTHQSSFYSTPPDYELNEQVRLYINKDEPKVELIDTFTERWLGSLVLCIMGVIFVSIMLLFLFLSRKL